MSWDLPLFVGTSLCLTAPNPSAVPLTQQLVLSAISLRQVVQTASPPGGSLPNFGCQCAISLRFARLKTVDVIIRSTQGAESLVKGYEVKLSQEEAVPADLTAIQSHRTALQVGVVHFKGCREKPASALVFVKQGPSLSVLNLCCMLFFLPKIAARKVLSSLCDPLLLCKGKGALCSHF